jgi:hypothetical protein
MGGASTPLLPVSGDELKEESPHNAILYWIQTSSVDLAVELCSSVGVYIVLQH